MDPVVAPKPLLAYRRYTYRGFLDTVYPEEHIAFITLAKTDPQLERFKVLAEARNLVDFNDPDTLAAAPYLVQVGIVSSMERLAELTG